MMPETKSIRVMISGRVQGVGYRAWCSKRAAALGLSGWVRNRKSGDVEAVLSGTADAVEAMVADLWEGPSFSSVSAVKIVEEVARVTGSFEFRPTV